MRRDEMIMPYDGEGRTEGEGVLCVVLICCWADLPGRNQGCFYFYFYFWVNVS